jgi:hypothetical protein
MEAKAEKPPILEPEQFAPVEVLPPLASQTAAGPPSDNCPIHALSALVMAAVDSLWAVFDWAPIVWPFAIPGCFVAVFLPAYLIQRHLKGDAPARAAAFASVLAVLAAIPIFTMGTPIGLGLMAWTGLGKFFGKRLKP